ncbi:son of sevenless homolog 1-like isoform X2 [Convolutriloba macropyga]|uniref:son of sevenless homolog 1-like isoform X2 n=1 Tax=Convolutriloba macropyga TaxID=536237 RepID=UPI003F521D76
MDVKYDFKSDANRSKWEKILIEGLEKILIEIHPTLTLTDSAALYIQDLILTKCLYPICTTFSNEIDVIKDVIMSKFPPPLNHWAVSEALDSITNRQPKNGKQTTQGKDQFLLPYAKLRCLICREFFQLPVTEVNEDVIWLIAGCVEFLCVDLIRLIGSFVKNLKCLEMKVEDVKNSLCADKVLLELLEISRDVNDRPMLEDGQSYQDWENLDKEALTEKYRSVAKLLIAEERQNLRNIQMILFVFIAPLQDLEGVPKQKFEDIFCSVNTVHEMSSLFLPRLEGILEFYGNETPLVGDAILQFAEEISLDPYVSFAENIAEDQQATVDYLNRYNEFLQSYKSIQQYFEKTKRELGYCAAEVYRYVLPRLMYNLVSHAANYFERFNALMMTSPDESDKYNINEALICLKRGLTHLRKMADLLPKREVYFRFVPKPIDQESRRRVDEFVKSLSGVDEETRKRMFNSGEIIMEGEWQRVQGTDKKSRLVYLLDGYIVCCRKKGNQLRVKECFRMREIEILDHERNNNSSQNEASGNPNGNDETSGHFQQQSSLTFQINVIDSQTTSTSTHSPPSVFHSHGKSSNEGYIFACDNSTEKQDWMVAMLSIHSRGTLERILDKYIAEEERKQPLRFPDADKYCFAKPDQKEGDINIITDSKSGVSKVKEATLEKLVERLTFHLHLDTAYIEDFFTTYRSFCEPADLFKLLQMRFNIPDIEPTEEEKQIYTTMEPPSVRKFRKEYAHPVQLRVLNAMRHWISNHYEDFKKDPKLLENMHLFIGEAEENKKWKAYCNSIQKILRNKEEDVKKKPDLSNENPPRVEWHLASPHDEITFNLITLHPLEIARQITLIESEMFRNVTVGELSNFGCCSSKDRDQKRRMFPNVVAWQNFNNKISYWFTYTILDTPNLEERQALLVRGWEIAQALEELNNFSGVLHVISGLNYSSVSRLKMTHEKLPKETKDIKHGLISKYIDSNLKFYRDALKKSNPPLVPYLGNTFTTVLHIEDSSTKLTSNALINFSKCRMISSQCRQIMMYQPMPYSLKPEESIQKYLMSQDPVGSHTESEWADKLHAMSLQLEPRESSSNFSLKQPSSSKSEKKYGNVSLKSPGIKPSISSKMVSKLSQSRIAMNSGDSGGGGGGGGGGTAGESKITTYQRPAAMTSVSSVPSITGRHRSSLSNSNNSDSTSPVAPSTPRAIMPPEAINFHSPHQAHGPFATIGSPVNLTEQVAFRQLPPWRGSKSMRPRIRNNSGGSSGSLQRDMQQFHSAFQFPSPDSAVSIGGGMYGGAGLKGHRDSVSSMSPDHISILHHSGSSLIGGSMSSMGSSPKTSITSGSTSTLGRDSGLSSMNLRGFDGSSILGGGAGSQHSPAASDITPPNSSGFNKPKSPHFAFNPHQTAALYGAVVFNHADSVKENHAMKPQFSPASTEPGHFTYPIVSPGGIKKPPPVPPRIPLSLNNELTPHKSASNEYDVAPTAAPILTSKPSISSPEKIPPRTPLNPSFTPPSSATMPRGSIESTKFPFFAKGGSVTSFNDTNSLDHSPGIVHHSSRVSMYDPVSSTQDLMDDHRMHNIKMFKSPMPPPRLTPRRSDLGSVSSTATIESLGNTTTPPPEIPAKTYKFPAMPAS